MKIYETQEDFYSTDITSFSSNYGIVKHAIANTKFKDVPMSDGYYLHSGNKTAIKSFDEITDFRCGKYGFTLPTSIGFFNIKSKDGTNLRFIYQTENGKETVDASEFSFIDLSNNTGDYLNVISFKGIDNVEFTYDNITVFNVIMGSICSQKFTDKWNRLYDDLIDKVYDSLYNQDYIETKKGTNKNTDTHNTIKGKNGNNSDTTTYDTNVTDDGKTGVNEVTKRGTINSNDVYGFNSTSPVGDTYSNEDFTETVEGDANKNTTHNTQIKTGTETKNFGISETETYTGTDTTDIDIDEEYTKKGRNITPSQLLMEEISFRDKQNFFDIIYRDIDSIATLDIYI